MKKTILCNYSEPSLIFAMATILRHSPEEIEIIPVDTQELDQDPQMLQTIVGDSEEIYLLNIGPRRVADQLLVLAFLEEYDRKIILNIDNFPGHIWHQAVSSYGKSAGINITLKGPSSLEVLSQLGYQSPAAWKSSEAAFNSNAQALRRNASALRFGSAYFVSNITGRKPGLDPNYIKHFFRSAVDELLIGRKNNLIEYFSEAWPKVVSYSRAAKKSFSGDHPLFGRAKKAGRPIGYLGLGEIPEYADLEDIMEYGEKKFPWLSILNYSFQGKERILMSSDFFSTVRIFSNLPANPEIRAVLEAAQENLLSRKLN